MVVNKNTNPADIDLDKIRQSVGKDRLVTQLEKQIQAHGAEPNNFEYTLGAAADCERILTATAVLQRLDVKESHVLSSVRAAQDMALTHLLAHVHNSGVGKPISEILQNDNVMHMVEQYMHALGEELKGKPRTSYNPKDNSQWIWSRS